MAKRNNQGTKNNYINRGNLLVFFVCLVISTLFWFLLAFNGNYTTLIKVPVEYINMPEKRMIIEKLPSELNVNISGSGYQLLSYMVQPELGKILLDGRNIGVKPGFKGNNAFLTTYHGIDFFNRQHADVKVLNIQPDTLFFSFFNRGLRKVPVKADAYLSFKKQYYLTDSLRLLPDSITISGPADRLDSIFQIKTEKLILNEIFEDGIYRLKIIQPDSMLSYEPLEVDLEINVDKYTEAVFTIPIRLEHLISSDSLEIFPTEVELTCMVALSNFNRLNTGSFIVAADAFDLRDSKSSQLTLYLREFPRFVKNVRIKPETVEYIIRKKD
jgi:hypothetical protein